MNGFEKRAEAKRLDILISAEKLFLKKVPNEITVEEIAMDAGVSKVTIFKYFDTKDKLIEEALLYHMEIFMKNIEKIVCNEDSFQKKLKKAMLFKSEEIKKFNAESYALFTKLIISGDERFVYYVTKNRKLTNKIFEQGKREGEISKDLSNEALELYMKLIGTGISTGDNIKEVIPLIDDIMDLICYGFAGNSKK